MSKRVIRLADIIPWGRDLDEYRAMFALDESDLASSILGCGDGPASFNAELTMRDGKVISIDPLYQFSARGIERRIQDVRDGIMIQVRNHANDFVWNSIKSVDELESKRMRAMNLFLKDFNNGLECGRYLNAALPELPFVKQQFSLALCSHLLFLYSHHLTFDFHLAAVHELCRVANEVRIFPLLDLDGVESEHLQRIIETLQRKNLEVDIVTVDYEFQRGGNQMMKIGTHNKR